MLILLSIHSIVRWAAVLVSVVLLIRLAMGIVQKKPFDKMASGLTSAFAGMLDTQLLLGLLYFIIDGFGVTGFPRYRWEHFIMMTVAVVVGHLPAMWKKQSDEMRTRNTLIAVLIALVLVFIGVIPLGGWVRWWHITGLF